MESKPKSKPAAHPANLPVTVDIPTPPDGFGERLDEMLGWCGEQYGDEQWAHYTASVAWPPSAPGIDVARFCFLSEDHAELFEKRWRK